MMAAMVEFSGALIAPVISAAMAAPTVTRTATAPLEEAVSVPALLGLELSAPGTAFWWTVH